MKAEFPAQLLLLCDFGHITWPHSPAQFRGAVLRIKCVKSSEPYLHTANAKKKKMETDYPRPDAGSQIKKGPVPQEVAWGWGAGEADTQCRVTVEVG